MPDPPPEGTKACPLQTEHPRVASFYNWELVGDASVTKTKKIAELGNHCDCQFVAAVVSAMKTWWCQHAFEP